MEPKKKFGQHWLRSNDVLETIADSAHVSSIDTVLEVGPGLGTLTTHLMERAKRVVAVEIDKSLSAYLETLFTDTNVDIVNKDILKYDTSKLPKGYKVVANIPYYLTGKLLRQLLEAKNPPGLIVLLVQKEVAERIAAEPGELSVLGVSAQLYSEVELGEVVSALMFDPPPKVDSQIVVLRRRSEPLVGKDADKFMKMVKAGFGEKRKKLRSALAGGLRKDKKYIDQILKETSINSGARAQELSLAQWQELYNKLYN